MFGRVFCLRWAFLSPTEAISNIWLRIQLSIVPFRAFHSSPGSPYFFIFEWFDLTGSRKFFCLMIFRINKLINFFLFLLLASTFSLSLSPYFKSHNLALYVLYFVCVFLNSSSLPVFFLSFVLYLFILLWLFIPLCYDVCSLSFCFTPLNHW